MQYADELIITPAGMKYPSTTVPPSRDEKKDFDFGTPETKAWKDVWSAGQGVGAIEDVPSVTELCRRMIEELGLSLEETA